MGRYQQSTPLYRVDTVRPEGVHPKMVFDPAWTPDMMSEDAKFALGF